MLVLDKHTQAVAQIGFSPDGKFFASRQRDSKDGSKAVLLWDLARQTVAHKFQATRSNLWSSFAFDLHSGLLALGHQQSDVTVFQVETGKKLQQLSPPHYYSAISTLGVFFSYSADGNEVRAMQRADLGWRSETGRVISCWRLDTWEPVAPIYLMGISCDRVGLTSDGTHLVTIDDQTNVAIRQVESGQLLNLYPHSEPIHSATVCPDYEFLLTAMSNRVTLWDIVTRKQLKTFTAHEHAQITAVRFSPDGLYFATAAEDGTVKLWDLETAGLVSVWDWEIGRVTTLEFSQDGFVIAAGGDQGIIIWDRD